MYRFYTSYLRPDTRCILAIGKWNKTQRMNDFADFAPLKTDPNQPDFLALIRNNLLLADITAHMQSGFLLLNMREQIAYANAQAVRLLDIPQHSPDQEINFDVRKHLLSLVVDPEHAHMELDQVWTHPEMDGSADLALTDTMIPWLRVRSFPIHKEPDGLLGRGLFLEDVTLEKASFQNRSETLALAAHELKTPLAVIKGCATTLLGSSMQWNPAMQRELLQMIDTHTDRLYEILNTLLDVWRLDEGAQSLRFSQVHISELISQLVARWQKNAPHHHFILTLPNQEVRLLCDAVRLEQAISNLLNNAVTYSPRGGNVMVRLEADETEYRLSVTDEGIGIAPEHLDRIFDRFYRVDNQEDPLPGKSGLGLAVARSVIEAHGGKIWVDSPGLDRGTTVYCTLLCTPHFSPRTQDEMVAPQSTGALPALPRSGALDRRKNRHTNILIAEKDNRLTRYLRANLEEQHYRVLTTGQGIQFLRQLEMEEPDMILLSSHLADINGVELLQQIREFSQVPVIMLCNESDEEDHAHLLDLGADDLVLKPFDMPELLARIRAILRRVHAAANAKPTSSPLFTTGDLTIDYAQHQVLVAGKTVQLSRTEYKLLATLAQNAGMVVTHELLLEKVWGPEYNREVDFIWVYISRLRRKIESNSRRPVYILTVPDVGYKLAKI